MPSCGTCRNLRVHLKPWQLAGYVTTTFKNGNDVKTAIEKMSVPSVKLPADLPTTATQAEKWRWEKKVDEGTKRELQLETTWRHYNLFYGGNAQNHWNTESKRQKYMQQCMRMLIHYYYWSNCAVKPSIFSLGKIKRKCYRKQSADWTHSHKSDTCQTSCIWTGSQMQEMWSSTLVVDYPSIQLLWMWPWRKWIQTGVQQHQNNSQQLRQSHWPTPCCNVHHGSR